MRLYNYLKEMDLSHLEQENEEIPLEDIVSDCKPFMKELKKSGYQFLYSGRMSGDVYMERKVRKDRRPKDTPEWIHDIIDNEFKDKFGVKARSQSLFAFNNIEDTKFFGDPFLIFPKGKYMFLFNKEIQDLYGNLGRELDKIYGKDSLKLMDEFEKSDKLVWNSLRERYEPPNTPGTIKAKNQHSDNSITKDEYLENVRSVVNKIVNSYEKTTSPKDIPRGKEVMIVSSEVWMIHFKSIDRQELIDQIDQMI